VTGSAFIPFRPSDNSTNSGSAPSHLIVREGLVEAARLSIVRGSKSFASASRLFDLKTRERVWLLYAWCRACDDIADAQDHGHALGEVTRPGRRLATIRMLTRQALSGELTNHAAFDALFVLARETGVTQTMADDVIAGFALDAEGWKPRTEADMLRYCYHVAGAVGVMMAVVMGVSPDDEDTLDRACDLGLAFQLSNIARDIFEDDAAGRCYLPADWLDELGIPPGEITAPAHRDALVTLTHRLGALVSTYEASARVGAARLAFRQRWAVLSASGIYGAIARKVARLGPRAWDRRVHTGKLAKAGFILRGLFQSVIRPRAVANPERSRRELAALAREAKAGSG